jgi:pyruvate dehydrogenase E1 component alpha subunit
MVVVTRTQMERMYEDMVTARRYEERLQEEYLEGKQPSFDISAGPIPGELHLAAGHEASGVGVCHHLTDDDTVTAPHRPHHVAIAKGVDLKRMTAEIFGRKAGLAKGKGGHMHLYDSDAGFACSGIIAEGCPPAVGAGLAAKKRNSDAVAVAFLGEGAIDQGAFFESLNFASVHELPVVFVIEDNDWAISMPKERVTDVSDGSQRAGGFEMPGQRVDTDDAVAIYEAAGKAIARARDGNGPTLLEVQVHRRMGHFMGDPQTYRPEDDVADAQARDSIERLKSDLRDHGATSNDLTAIETAAADRVDEAIAWAKDQPTPSPEDAYTDVFTSPPRGVADQAEAPSQGGDD